MKQAPESEGQWIGAIIVALGSRGFYDEADSAVHELLEFEPNIRKAAVAYLKDHDKSAANYFARLTRERTAQRRKVATAEKE